MGFPHSENWDGVTAPSVPSGWNYAPGAYETVTSPVTGGASPISSPNMLQLPAGSGQTPITWGTADTSSGNVTVTGSGLCDVAFSIRNFSIFYLCNASTCVPGTSDYYELNLDESASTLSLYVRTGASSSTLGSVTGISLSANDWYYISASKIGSNHTAYLQRASDSNYWYSGAWNSTPGNAITATDLSLSGSGYAGLIGDTGLSSDIYFDNWNFTSSRQTSLAATGGNDTLAGSASFTDTGSFSKTAGSDTFSGSAAFLAPGVLAQTSRNDSFSASVAFTDTGSAAPAERHDVGSIYASVNPGLRATERHDAFSASATAGTEPPGALAGTGGSDVFSGTGGFTFDSPASFNPTESGDAFSATVLEASPAVLTPTERSDSFSAPAIVTTVASMAATESQDAFVGGYQTVAYAIYANTGAGDPINYNSPIATTLTTTYTTSPLSYPGVWEFGVRAYYTISGLEEQNLDCSTTIILSATGQDITDVPGPPSGLRALAMTGGAVRVEWVYGQATGPTAPSGFHVYIGTTGVPNYASPVTVTVPGVTGSVTAVPFSSGRAGSFVANIAALTNGTTYAVGVRAFNATGEETNTNIALVTADATGPSPVDSLVGVATSQA